jgi:hypothetical protein
LIEDLIFKDGCLNIAIHSVNQCVLDGEGNLSAYCKKASIMRGIQPLHTSLNSHNLYERVLKVKRKNTQDLLKRFDDYIIIKREYAFNTFLEITELKIKSACPRPIYHK